MTAAQPTAGPGTIGTGNVLSRLAGMPLLTAAIIATAAFAALDLSSEPSRLVTSLGDSDDATRLVQVREFMAGAPWLDTTLSRFGWPEHLVSHWSRLIDLGLATTMRVLGFVLPHATAELVARAIWPLVLMVPLLLVVGRSAERRAGHAAGLIAIGLAATCITGTVEYLPGRIDHHNAMILGALAGILLLSRGFAEPRLGTMAGIALGLGTAVGFESIVLTLAALATAALLQINSPQPGRGVAEAAQAYAGTLGVVWLLTTAPAHWLTSRCDALSINLVVLACAGALGVHLAFVKGREWPLQKRLMALAGAGVAGLALYGLAEPACLKGPFGQQDPAIGPIWMANVTETQSILWLLKTAPGVAIVFLASTLLGLLAAWRLAARDRDNGAVLLLATLAIATLLACWQIKLVPYASLLAVLPLACVVSRLEGSGSVSAPTVRAIGVLASCQIVLALVTAPLAAKLQGSAQAAGNATQKWAETAQACISTPSITPLAAVSRGRIFADRDLGPFIAALTTNSVLVAPYHRMDKAILEADVMWMGPAEMARARLAELRVDHVAMCPGLTRLNGRTAAPDSLHTLLHSGAVPAWLEPIALGAATPIKVWRVKRD